MRQTFSDELGQEHVFSKPPERIVSLVPSDTYSVARLGAGDRLVGRTDYCFEPAALVAKIPSVGGTKDARIADIVALAPDLVFANQEENTERIVKELGAAKIKVFVTFPRRVTDSLAHVARLARILGTARDEGVRDLVKRGYEELRAAESAQTSGDRVRVFCPIWMEPLMTINEETFISDMLETCGAENVFGDRARLYPLAADLGQRAPMPTEKIAKRDTRYPRVTLEEVIARAPDAVLLPDEPHPFSEADAEVFRALPIPAARFGTVLRISGKDICWPGVQTIEGLTRVRALVDDLRGRIASPKS